jgi:transcriptional regulator GlxA family with amidase domain
MSDSTRPARVGVLAFDGCLSGAVVGLLDAFHLANRWTADGELATTPTRRFSAQLLAARPTVTGTSGITLHCQRLEDAGDAMEIVIVPPMSCDPASAIVENRELVAFIASYAKQGGIAASVCAGAFFLAEAGLLSGRRATTNPFFASAFQRAHPDTTLLLERRVVDEGRVVTAGSITAFLDLAVYLVDRFAGHAVATLTAKALSIDKNHRSQLPYFLPFADKGHGDAAVLGLQTWLEDHFAEPVSAQQLARRSGLSQRSLNRRFPSATGSRPMEYLHRLRIEAAKRLLETSDLHIQEITSRVGYQDARSFSRLFRAGTGQSPGQYRARFGSNLDALEAARATSVSMLARGCCDAL